MQRGHNPTPSSFYRRSWGRGLRRAGLGSEESPSLEVYITEGLEMVQETRERGERVADPNCVRL